MKNEMSLSFDFEECDLPREHGVEFPIEKGMLVSIEGANTVLDVLERFKVRATIFCTLNFAERAPEVMKRIVAAGHEVAAHGVDHWKQTASDPRMSKIGLEKLTRCKVVGYRQPRMFPVSDADLKSEGFLYNSSLNPAFVPGRYMHLSTPRTPFMKDGLLQIPASVTPILRLPLFWLALHNFPEWFYQSSVRRTWKHDGYFVTYFHPWEFIDLNRHPEWNIPCIIRRNSGEALAIRLSRFINAALSWGANFVTIEEHARKVVVK